jgi:hypothetical protein
MIRGAIYVRPYLGVVLILLAAALTQPRNPRN